MENVIKKQASRRKYHYIYKTTCIITKRFYIGMHSTDNLEDGYIGSGKRLWHSINKHGKENHVCQILEFLESRDDLKAREKEIVNVELIGEELCMNLQIGGGGGFSSVEHELKFKESSKKNQGSINITIHSRKNDKLFWEQYIKNKVLGLKKQ